MDAGTKGSVTYYQEITDFTAGTDKIALANAPTAAADVGHSATTFASVSDAQVYAQTQLAGGGFTVEALSVGTSGSSSTYLFYNDQGSADGIIHLDGVTAASITNTAFMASSMGAPV